MQHSTPFSCAVEGESRYAPRHCAWLLKQRRWASIPVAPVRDCWHTCSTIHHVHISNRQFITCPKCIIIIIKFFINALLISYKQSNDQIYAHCVTQQGLRHNLAANASWRQFINNSQHSNRCTSGSISHHRGTARTIIIISNTCT